MIEPLETTLQDGTRVLFRPISPEDKQRIVDGFAQMSEESRYRRFFSQIDELSAAQLAYLTEVDFQDHFAWIAILPDERGAPGVGVGRWVRIPEEPEVAEGAVTVIDPFQNRGIGTLLLWLAARSAAERGIKAFRVWVQGENHPALAMLRTAGVVDPHWEAGVAQVDIALPGDPALLDEHPSRSLLRAAATGTIKGRSALGPDDAGTTFLRSADSAPDRT